MNDSSFLAVIFDLDGTLIDSLADLADAANGALAEFGYPVHPVNAYRRFVGNGIEALMRRALPEGEAPGPKLAEVVAAMRVRYDGGWHTKTTPYPGIPEVLRALAARDVPLAVLSNKPDDWCREIVRHFFPDVPFAAVRGARPDIPAKPDPAGALRLAESLRLAPGRIAFVGDSNVDMLTATRAGMLAVGATWGFRDAPELRDAGAAALIDHPARLMELR